MLADFRSGGGTIMMTTHDVAQGLRCADRVIVIDQGQIIFDHDISQIDQSRFVNDYLQYSRESA